MPRRYNEVEAVVLGDLRPGYVIVSRRVVDQVVATTSSVTVTFSDGSTLSGPPDAGLEVLASSITGRRRDDTPPDETTPVPIEDLEALAAAGTPVPALDDADAEA